MPFVFEFSQKVTVPTCKVAVLGGGSWATAIVKILSTNMKKVYWWVREPEIVEGVRNFGHNPLYLNEAELRQSRISVSNNLKLIIKKADIIVIVIPSAYLDGSFSALPENIFEGKSVISATKGMLPESMETVTTYMRRRAFGHHCRSIPCGGDRQGTADLSDFCFLQCTIGGRCGKYIQKPLCNR